MYIYEDRASTLKTTPSMLFGVFEHIHTYKHTYIHTYTHTHIHAYMLACIHTYTYIHT